MPTLKILAIMIIVASTALGTPVINHLGFQFWGLRHDFQPDVSKGLDVVKGFGFSYVETSGTFGLLATDFQKALASRGLKPVAAHFDFARFENDLPGVIADARALGASYVVAAWLPMDEFNVATAHEVAARFNTWGAALNAAGLKFAFHPCGYEFQRLPDGSTTFDLLVSLTKPEVVLFEMDVFWVTHAGLDPVQLLSKYPDRWRLMHLKDMRHGAPTGLNTRTAPEEDNVAIGAGVIDWPAVLRTAVRIGVDYYFIEDETTAPRVNTPISILFLKDLKY